jgi:hypothetical protein
VNLAEELFLCGIPEGGVMTSPKMVQGIGGAIVAELVLTGKIKVNEVGIDVLDPEPPGDPLLDDLFPQLEAPEAREARPEWFIPAVGKDRLPKVRERLIETGAVTVEKGEKRKLWMAKPDRLVPTPAGEEPRARVRAVLRGEAEATDREAALVGLVSACGLVKALVGDGSKEAEARAADIAAAAPMSADVRESIRLAQSAVAGSVTAAQ